jgi:hypothetical protein
VDAAADRTDEVLSDAVRDCRARAEFGSFNFVLSDGVVTYAYRSGRSLFLLERAPREPVVVVASERLSDERWEEVEEAKLLRIDAHPAPRWRALRETREPSVRALF